jgi:hypothetical protein
MTLTAPRDTTIRRLFAVSMNRCAFPGCNTPIIDSSTNTILAEVCHIHAQRIGGPRFDSSQTDEERHGFDNLVLMCGVHHKLIDAPENVERYSSDHLKEIKQQHEQAARASGAPASPISDELVAALLEATARYENGAVHMDLNNAIFRVGGEGGSFGGGGGGGGILTIVGTTRLPSKGILQLNGGDGQAPGGGGGATGTVAFVGRPADTDDVANGLRVSSIFTANAVSLNELFNVLGGAWTHLPLPSLPRQVRFNVLVVLELGTIEPESLIRLEIQIIDPHETVVCTIPRDIGVPRRPDLTPRVPIAQALDFEVTAFGVWTIKVQSSHIELATHTFECRQGELL